MEFIHSCTPFLQELGLKEPPMNGLRALQGVLQGRDTAWPQRDHMDMGT